MKSLSLNKRRIYLGLMTRPRKLSTRIGVGLTALATFFGPLHLAVIEAAPAAPSTSLPDDQGRRSSERLRPTSIEDVDGRMASEGFWRLFDGDAKSGVEAWAPIRMRLTFAEPVAVDAIGAFGPASGSLKLLGTDGNDKNGAVADLTSSSGRWTRLPVKAPAMSRTFVVGWTPVGVGSTLPELEVWGRASGGGHLATDEASGLADALYRGIPDGAQSFAAAEAEHQISASVAPDARTFTVKLAVDARAIERAFLVYELRGQPHFTAAKRSINGSAAVGGFGTATGASGGLQVEEISPQALRQGKNTFRFDPPTDADPVGYRVGNLRVVTVSTDGARGAAEGVDLADGNDKTGWDNKNGGLRHWHFAGLTQPRELEIRLTQSTRGALHLTSKSAAGTAKVDVDLANLTPGWHKVALDALPPSETLTAILDGGREGNAFVSEATITGSPLPVPGKAPMRVTYPLHGECVGHRVHVRALWATPATQLTANSKSMTVAREAGGFNFTAGEKELGGAGGKPFSFPIHVTDGNGASADATIAIAGCLDRPVDVASADGSPSRPVEDRGAPSGAIVSPEKGGALSFAGASLQVPPGAVDSNVRLTMRPLSAKDVPPLDAGMTNVTTGGRAFRLGPHGMHFRKAVALSLPIDRVRIEKGQHVHTLYFDDVAHKWREVTVNDEQAATLTAETTHFTDFIAATIAWPEHPGLQNLNPTSLKDIKLADPGAGIALIDAPQPNAQGTANLDYPIEVPPGRMGMQPRLAISYNSEAANGWLGVGWDLRTSCVEIDTRFGVPHYTTVDERYSLDGQELTRLTTPPSGAPAGGVYYARRFEGQFDWIQRVGTGGNYSWLVTDKRGHTFTYGKADQSRLMKWTGSTPDRTKTFRWCIEQEQDPWGNQVNYTYATDKGSLPLAPGAAADQVEYYQQIYPATVTYTDNAAHNPAPLYSVVFTSKTGTTRPDAFYSGRAGFLVYTKQLLDHVEVKNGTTVVRRYNLVYVTGDFNKSLLSTITLLGKGGSGNALAVHNLNYFAAPRDTNNNPKYFGDPKTPQPWNSFLNGDGSASAGSSFNDSSSTEASYGASIGTTGANIGASHVDVDTNGDRWVEDINGDGLPDLLPNNASDGNRQSLQFSTPTDGTPPAVTGGKISVASFPGWTGPSGTETCAYMSSSYDVLISGSEDYGNISQTQQFIQDVNGDGLPDRVKHGSAADKISVELNNGQFSGFQSAQEIGGYTGTGLKFDCNDIFSGNSLANLKPSANATAKASVSPVGPSFPSVDIVTMWRAPWAGRVKIGGAMKKVESGGDGVNVQLYVNNNIIWTHDINDTNVCYPTSTGNGCSGTDPPLSSSYTVTVRPGDRIYTRTNAKQNADNDLLLWDNTITYVDTPASEVNAWEATGVKRYTFSEANDSRGMGQFFSPWTAPANGNVSMQLDVDKSSTADDVDLVVKGHTPTGEYTMLQQTFAASSTTKTTINITPFYVNAGDEVHIWTRSSLPIDPDGLQVTPTVTYTNFCRTDPASGNAYCGTPHCVAKDPSVPNAGQACTIEPSAWTGVSKDPLAAHPVAGSIINQVAPVYRPLEPWIFNSNIAVSPPTTTPDGRKTMTSPVSAPGKTYLCLYSNDPALTGQPVTLVVQTIVPDPANPNHRLGQLLGKKAITIPTAGGEFPCATTVFPGRFDVPASAMKQVVQGQQVFFSVFSESPLRGTPSFAAAIGSDPNPDPVPPESVDYYYRDTARSNIAQYPYFGTQEYMGGGFHQIFAGTWNGNQGFDESQIYTGYPNQYYQPLYAGTVPADEHSGGSMLGATGIEAGGQTVRTQGLLGVIKKGLGLAYRGLKFVYDKVKAYYKFKVSLFIAGYRYLFSLVGKIMAWAMCEISDASYTVDGMKFSETHSVQKGVSNGVIGISMSNGTTVSGMDLIDMNGDRYPDQVSTSGIRYLNYLPPPLIASFGPAAPTVFVPGKALRLVLHSMHTATLGVGGAGGDSQSSDAQGHSSGVQVGPNLSVRLSQGYSRTLRDIRDINGDGLPDIIDVPTATGTNTWQVSVRLNYGNGFSNPIIWNSAQWVAKPTLREENLYNGSATKVSGNSSMNDVVNAIADATGVDCKEQNGTGAIRVEETAHAGATIGLNVQGGVATGGVGFGIDKTYVRTIVDLIDVNGDGLPDQVMKEPKEAYFRVKLNTGTGFATEVTSAADAWPSVLLLFTGGKQVNASDADALTFSRGEDWNANASAGAFGASGTGSYGESGQKLLISLMDIDGDGRVDQVLKNADTPGNVGPNNAKVYARLNQVGKTNLLKSVTRPLGGTITLDYQRTGNAVTPVTNGQGSLNVDSPDSRWVLSKVTSDDGRGNTGSNAVVDAFDYRMPNTTGPDAQVTSGFYDRNERQFYGYARIKVTHADKSQKWLYFKNQGYHDQGRLLAEYDIGTTGYVLRGSVNTYNYDVTPGSSAPSSEYLTYSYNYDVIWDDGRVSAATLEAQNPTSVTALPAVPTDGSMVHYSYKMFDNAGNVVNVIDYGDRFSTVDDVKYVIHYAALAGHLNPADSVTASSLTDGSTLQSRQAAYDTTTTPPRLKTITDLVYRGNKPGTTTPYDGNATTAAMTYTFGYDGFGNVSSYKEPSGYTLTYVYDTTTSTHVNKVTDSFGYTSSSTTDMNFGLPLTTTDANGQVVTYNYDNWGRTTKVWGPTDPTTGTATLQMSYSQAATSTPVLPAWAMTRNKDGATTNTIDTATFADGFARIIQTKKEADVMVGTTKTQGFTMSGLQVFDNRGRLMSQSQPTFVAGTGTTLLQTFTAAASKNPTVYGYDALGRNTSVTLADGALTSTRYATVMASQTGDDASGAQTTLEMKAVTDPLGNVTGASPAGVHTHRTYTDGLGRVVAVKEFNTVRGTRKALFTNYTYDGLGNLVKATDALSNATNATYDSLNRMVTLKSTDAAQVEYRYGLDGQLAEKLTGVLGATKPIKYAYDVNRLKTITYPTLPAVTYTYGASTESGASFGNVAGRIKNVTMEGGSEARQYDAFGNVSQAVTTLKQITGTGTPIATMKFSYDWMGRMQTMTFPQTAIDANWNIPTGDGEVVTFAYDHGGLIQKITGVTAGVTETYLADMQYDEFGQRLALKSGNNIVNQYTYDPARRFLKTVNATGNSSVQFQAMTYSYDVAGNITGLNNAPPDASIAADANVVGVGPMTVTYGYDEQNQLTSSTAHYRGHKTSGYRYTSTFGYDEIGNMISKAQSDYFTKFTSTAAGLTSEADVRAVADTTYTLTPNFSSAGHPHSALSVAETPGGTRSVTYDLNGNKTGDTLGSTTRTFTWDEENRLKKVTQTTVGTSQFLYNPDGERTQHLTPDGKTTFYVNQFLVLHGDRYVTKHIWAGETRVVSKMEGPTGTPVRQFYHSDNLGSSSYVTDASKNLLEHDRYFPFGQTWAESGLAEVASATVTHRPWLFTSKELDSDTGLYYYGARYYDPRAATWQSADPMLRTYLEGTTAASAIEPKNLELYGYAWNSPATLRDSTGNCVEDFCITEAAIVAYLQSPAGQRTMAVAGAALTVGVAAATGVAARAWNGVRNWWSSSQSSNDPPAASSTPVVPPVTANRAKGKAFEADVKKTLEDKGRTDIGEQVMVKTKAGTRFVPDFVSKDQNGVPKVDEAKASDTARLTPAQKKGIPELAKDGGEVVGKGKPGWPGGTKIPPTDTTIHRPK